MEGETLRTQLTQQASEFLNHFGGKEFTESLKEKFKKKITDFWEKIQYLHTTLIDLQDETILDTWLSPVGMVFVYHQLSEILLTFHKGSARHKG